MSGSKTRALARSYVGEGQPRPSRVPRRSAAHLRWRSLVLLVAAILVVWGGWSNVTCHAQPPSRLAQVPAVPMPEVEFVEAAPATAAIPPRNTGPQAMARSRYRRGRHGTTRIIRRTPAVMREDAARVKRGDLFSTWSNEYLE